MGDQFTYRPSPFDTLKTGSSKEENSSQPLPTGDSLRMYTLLVGDEDLHKHIAELRRVMECKWKDLRGVERYSEGCGQSPFVLMSHALYTTLIPEAVRPLLKGGKTLLVVPTGPLYALPFEMLITQPADHVQDAHYLIKDLPISYLSSASLLKTLREARARRKAPAPYPLLAFAHLGYEESSSPNPSHQGRGTDSPLLAGEGSGVRSLKALRHKVYQELVRGYFKELPETAEEVKAIQELLGAPDTPDPL
jgi:hypothetical protein